MTDACDTINLLLQAELDGELDAAGVAGLTTHVQTCPGCAALRTDLAVLSTQLRTGLPRYAAPPTLSAGIPGLPGRVIPRGSRSPWFRRSSWGHAGSFAAGLAVAASVALFVIRPVVDRNALPDAVSAHVRALQPGHLLDVVSSDRHTVKPWFDGRLDFSPAVPNLAAQGFPLLGGRLDYFDGSAAAALVYGRDKHIIDVFVRPWTGPGINGSFQGYNVLSWAMNGLAYEAISDLNLAEFSTFARLMQASGS